MNTKNDNFKFVSKKVCDESINRVILMGESKSNSNCSNGGNCTGSNSNCSNAGNCKCGVNIG